MPQTTVFATPRRPAQKAPKHCRLTFHHRGSIKLSLNLRHPNRIADAGGGKVWGRSAAIPGIVLETANVSFGQEPTFSGGARWAPSGREESFTLTKCSLVSCQSIPVANVCNGADR